MGRRVAPHPQGRHGDRRLQPPGAAARGADGRPIAIIELNSDITERKRAEEELADTAGLLERTQEISKTGGWEYDLATGKLTWTDEVYRIYGGERRSGPVELGAGDRGLRS